MRTVLTLLIALVLTAGGASAQDAGKTFVREDAAAEALRLEAQLTREFDPRGSSTRDWIADGIDALRADDWRAAATAFATAVASNPDSERAWRNYAVATLRIEPEDWDERYELPRRAVAAAYKAYLLSQGAGAEARALALLGDAFARRELYRPALDSYAASLGLRDDPDVRATYETMREEHGFRVLDYSVDSDAASPRACIQFSEPLAEGRIDFSSYVAVAGMDRPAVTADEAQVCIDGLEHGRDYQVEIRVGLPSSVGENLQRSAALSIYVRDRSPAARFTGRNYVLPSRGQNGIPLVTVNVDEVAAALYRVGERGVAPAVIAGDFQRQLAGTDYEELTTSRGVEVWSGTMPVDRRLNEDVTTAFPVHEAAGELEPGVYVLVAWPGDREPEYWDSRATQWFVVSDLGMTAIDADDGLHLFVRSLASAEAVAGATVELIARSNDVLGTATTDADGHATISAGLTRGTGGAAPAVLVARDGDADYAFLDLTGPAFDLTDRGVAGRAAPGPLDAFVVTERGVYRPGETVHVTALLRDNEGLAVPDLPLTLVAERPDGAEDRRAAVGDLGDGGRTWEMPLVDTATTGTWRLRAYVDPDGDPVGEATFLVEDYVPERLELDLTSDADAIAPGDPATVSVTGRWLYGAPAAGLAVDGSVTVRAAEALPSGFAGYRFGLTDETFPPVRGPVAPARTDADGTAGLEVTLPELPPTTRPLEAEIAVDLREPGGRALQRSLTLPVAADAPVIGVRPTFGERAGSGETVTFDVVALGAAGERIAMEGLNWELVRLERRYQWYRDGADWRYETIVAGQRVADGRIDVDADAPARIAAPVEWGEYRLEVTTDDPAGPATSVTFDAGWNAVAAADAPDALEVALDRDTYAPGDTARLRIDSRFAGEATVVVVSGAVREVRTVEIPRGESSVDLPVGEDWGAGAYVVASLARPLNEDESRMPGRAVGLAWLGIDAAPHTLDVALAAPERSAPRERFDLPLSLGGLEEGEDAQIVVAAVDVGILNLTGYEAPAPSEWYFGQRRLGAEIRDLYGQLIDGMGIERGRLRTGGDAGGAGLEGSPPTQAPLALFSGIVSVGPDGEAEVSFELPDFNGTMRVMAIAWSGDKVGDASADVIVADPVVVTASVPRFLADGDSSRLRFDVHNATGPAGGYRLTVATRGPLAGATTLDREIAFDRGQRVSVELPVEAAGIGEVEVIATLAAPDGGETSRTVSLPVRPANPPVTRRSVATLEAERGRASVGPELLADIVPGTGRVTVSVEAAGALDVAGRLAALDTYPYGCSEQIASRALPLLYLSELDAAGVLDATAVSDRIADAIVRVLAHQDSSGGFGLWSPGGNDLWLDSYVTDFLTRARDAGYAVPARAVSLALDRLANTLAYAGDFPDGEGADVAYAHYVLARNGRARLGDLRYLADVRLEAIDSPLARAQIGAALAVLGDADRASAAFASARERLEAAAGEPERARSDYGSTVRDGAAMLALTAETDVAANIVPAVARRVETTAEAPRTFSTQENAWMVLAARALRERAEALRLEVDGVPVAGPVRRELDEAALRDGLTVANTGDEAAQLTVRVEGAPASPEPPASEGFVLERRYYTLDGAEADPATARQNDRFVVVLTVFEPEPQPGRVLLVDHLPAGFEIDNPRLVGGTELDAFGWLEQDNPPEHAEFRDDRFAAAFDRSQASGNSYSAAYVVRAVSPGDYAMPAATVEDMYRPTRFARTQAGRLVVEPAQ